MLSGISTHKVKRTDNQKGKAKTKIFRKKFSCNTVAFLNINVLSRLYVYIPFIKSGNKCMFFVVDKMARLFFISFLLV